jgi:hypothetical protein
MRKRCKRIYPNKGIITEKRPTGEKVKPSQKKNYTGSISPHTACLAFTTESRSREKRLVKAIDEERIGEMILGTYMLLWQLQDTLQELF